MFGDHHHHHHHGHDHDHDHDDAQHPHAPADPASQSLSDALLVSFRLLKGIMFLVLLGYAASGTFSVDANEEAVVLTLGKMEEQPRQPGLNFAAPYPFSERFMVRVKEKKTLNLSSFWFRVSDADRGKPVHEMSARMGGLEPGVDGALMTGDRNLVHLDLQVQYYIHDAIKFVKALGDTRTLEDAIAGAVDSAAVAAVAAADVDEILRGQVEQIMLEVKREAQATLDRLDCGVRIDSVIALNKTWPLQTAPAFVRVQRAENEKLQRVEEARGEGRSLLNQAAGPAYRVIAEKITEHEAAQAAGDEARVQALDDEIIALLETAAAGESARVISEANSYKAEVIQEVQAAAQLFRELLPEYRNNPALVRERLWKETVTGLFNADQLGVELIFIPNTGDEIRILAKPSRERQKAFTEEQARKEREQGSAGNR